MGGEDLGLVLVRLEGEPLALPHERPAPTAALRVPFGREYLGRCEEEHGSIR